jgi:hypothetical protein
VGALYQQSRAIAMAARHPHVAAQPKPMGPTQKYLVNIKLLMDLTQSFEILKCQLQ